MSQNVTRRAAMVAGAAAGALAALPAFSNEAITPLKDLAAAKGLRFGTAIGMKMYADPKVRDLVIRECNIIVPENELKMYVTHNKNPTDYNFKPADELLAFAETNHIAMRGHNLFWARDEFTPKWLIDYKFSGKAEAEKDAARLYRHRSQPLWRAADLVGCGQRDHRSQNR
ncbi:MAG: endo-1,4-beta-xylanase [Asticcacaulis sp.]|nr:endo-1,4-beta-xylanase [Asticcacaulis sp.]